MKVNGRDFRAIFWSDGMVAWIDQTRLPFEFRVEKTRSPEALARAIENMAVRGAPTIGAAAAYALALAFRDDRPNFFNWCARIRATRPTAVNLFHACSYMEGLVQQGISAAEMVDAACAYSDAEVARNRKMGEIAAEHLSRDGLRILTHCNAGWLAAVDWGTALAGIYFLARSGENVRVWVNETRPRLQGAKLTAWELKEEGISHRILVDGAAAWLMARGEVDAVIVGADRIAMNGDVANKIGTYMLSLAAKQHGIPFYVVAPSSTFDPQTAKGDAIPIEERVPEEVIELQGMSVQGIERVRIAPDSAEAYNPAFDVTPYENITATIHEKGVWRP